jgi:hypothetical protein
VKTVLVDSSSAILLYKAELFQKLTEIYGVMLAEAVWDELACDGYPGAEEFKESDVMLFRVFTDDTPFGKGEAATIAGYLQGFGDFVLIDDGAAAKYCKEKGIPFINALLLPKILYLSGIVDGTEYRKMAEHLTSLGRYSRKVIEYAACCGRSELEFFFP